jgi:hypothetical protein
MHNLTERDLATLRVINSNPHGTMDHLAHNATSAPRHAPAPWSVDRRACCLAVVDGNGQELAFYYDAPPVPDAGSVTARGRTTDEIRANAVLHAASPTMLAALREALPWLIMLGDKIGNGTPDDPDGRCRAVAAVRAAIDEAQA